jgi:hypothetical protein
MDYERLSAWINLLSEQDVRNLKHLSILCAGRVLRHGYIPSFPEWHDLIVQLYERTFAGNKLAGKCYIRPS